MDMNLDGNKNVYMSGCHGNFNQQFMYESSSQRIVMPGQGCLDWDTGGVSGTGENSVVISNCHGNNNQRWYRDSSGRLHSYHDGNKCIDDGNGNLYMHDCVSSSSRLN